MKELNAAIKNFQVAMRDVKIPPCFDSESDYEFWLQGEKEIPTQPIRRFICRDCTSNYQKKMIVEGRCFNDTVNIQKIAKR